MPIDEQPPKTKRTGKRRKPRDEVVPDTENVVHLFGPDATKRDDPDGVVPERQRGSKRQNSQTIKVSGRWAEVYRDIHDGKITMREFVQGLDKEELARGQMRDKNGGWAGAPPKWIPAELHQECMRELMRRGDEIWREAYIDSISVFRDIAKSEQYDAKDRLKAAQYVVERLAGKTPDRVELAVVQPWEELIGGIVAEAEDEAISRAARLLAGESPTQ